MGGCRCTYRNCTVKSDRKTHMFHYPVFERVRCHQWLKNARRLDFLDLKVSQLKNRVVCQHHFKAENFMNFKKDKLTFDAIPTEDGPYCETPSKVDMDLDSLKLFSIMIDDIEDEYIMTDEKKANYSVKYGDFLANLDLMDIEKIDNDSTNYKTINNSLDTVSPVTKKSKDLVMDDDHSFVFNISLPDKTDKKYGTQPTLAVSPYINNINVNHRKAHNYHKQKINDKNDFTKSNKKSLDRNETSNVEPNQQTKQYKKEPKIKIISEKRITDPVSCTGKFEPVPPNFLLNVSNLKNRVKTNTTKDNANNKSNTTIENNVVCKQEVKGAIEIEVEPYIKEDAKSTVLQNSLINMQINSNESEKNLRKMSLLKSKVTPERVEAINKKRKFNMKLKDMVASCLDNIDSFDQVNKKIKPVENNRKVPRGISQPDNTSNGLPTPILGTQEYTIAFIDKRIKKMEDTLIEKIEQNSKKIVELQQTFIKTLQEQKSLEHGRDNEEVHKKKLFRDISKYLSSGSSSLIYEELFIKKFGPNESKISPKRKRRR